MRPRDLTIRTAAILLLLTIAAILVHGYHPGAEDDFVYLPAIKRDLNPALFPHDADFFRLQLQATVFDKVVAGSVKLTHAPLGWALLIWQTTAIFMVLLGCWKIARRCFLEPANQWAAVTLISVLLTMPVAGTALYLLDQHLHPRTLATAFVLFAICAVLDGRFWRTTAWVVLAFFFHPLMAAFGASYCVFLAWPEQGRHKTDLHKPRRKILQQVGRSASLLVPLGWVFEQPNAAWRQAAATRDYYFLGRQTWYEWLGTLAPLIILWWFRRIGLRSIGSSSAPDDRDSSTRLGLMCQRLIYFAIFQFAVTLVIMLPPQLERFRTFQPLRYLHLVYLLMLLFAGGLIGKHILRTKVWRWAVLFVPIALGMAYAQRQQFPASSHVETPFVKPSNPWLQAFAWIRTHTPTDAYFALGPRFMQEPGEDWHSFRGLAERSRLADDLKDPAVSTQVPSLAARWQRESQAQKGWNHFQKSDFERLQREFGVNWVVLDKKVSGLDCPYHSGAVQVCRVE